MRVTTSMIQSQITDSMAGTQEKLLKTQTQISTTKEVSRSSDSPTRYDRAARFRTLEARNDLFVNNIDDGLGWIQSSTTSLESAHELLIQVRERGLRSRNDFDISARSQTASEIDSFLSQLVSLGNTDHIGKFVFGGTKTQGTEPFSFDGTTITYNGNTSEIKRKVGVGTFTAINVTGDTFTSALEAVLNLRDALNAGNDAGIDTALTSLESGMDAVLATSSKIGSQQRRLELTRENLQVANINLQSYISQAEDVDLSEAILRFNSQELGFRAALESSNRIQNITILDYIR